MSANYVYLLIGLGVFVVVGFSAIAYLETHYHNKKMDV